MTLTKFERLLEVFIDHKVNFIVIGGLAAIYHGSARLTQDIDLVYDRSDDNLKRIESCLAPLNPYLREAPPGLPFSLDFMTLKAGLNFTLVTDLGSIDLIGDAPGGGTYPLLLDSCEQVPFGEKVFRCVDLNKLIELKRAAGRAKDLEAIAELELIRDSAISKSQK